MKFKNYFIILVLLILSLGVIKSLFIPGFFPMHDDTQVSRIYEMGRALSDGMFPVRWVPDLGYGYGYPIFNFYAPLSYYVGGLLTVIGIDVLSSTKIAFGLGLLMSGVFMYFLGKTLWGNLGGIISSLLYVYAPYHAVNVYVRGDLAEVWGYAFLPLFFFGLINIYKTLELKFVVIASLGLSGIILSHNLTAFMTSIFFIFAIVFFTIFSKDRVKFLAYSLGSFGLGSLMSAFYFIPALFEMQFTNILSQVGGGADFKNHFVCISQLWEGIWGYGGSTSGCLDGMSFRIGKLHLILSIVSLFILFLKKKNSEKRFLIFLGLSLFISIFFMLPISKFIWEIIPFMEFLQYPWRFLIFASFATSLLGGGSIILVKLLPQNMFKHGALEYTILFSFLTIFIYSKLFVPQTILPKTSSDYVEKSILNYKISKISDEYMPKNFDKPKNFETVPKDVFVLREGNGSINLLQKKTGNIKAKVIAPQDSVIHANIAYFPAWKVLINGKTTNFNIKNNGFDFNVPKGESDLTLIFSQTSIEKVSNVLSVIALTLLFAGIIFRKKIVT